jgi:hypothetical protein
MKTLEKNIQKCKARFREEEALFITYGFYVLEQVVEGFINTWAAYNKAPSIGFNCPGVLTLLKRFQGKTFSIESKMDEFDRVINHLIDAIMYSEVIRRRGRCSSNNISKTHKAYISTCPGSYIEIPDDVQIIPIPFWVAALREDAPTANEVFRAVFHTYITLTATGMNPMLPLTSRDIIVGSVLRYFTDELGFDSIIASNKVNVRKFFNQIVINSRELISRATPVIFSPFINLI